MSPRYRLYGLILQSDRPFPELLQDAGLPHITLRSGEPRAGSLGVSYFRSPLLGSDGTPVYTLYDLADGKLIDIPAVARFEVNPDISQVSYEIHPHAPEELFRTWVLGTVAALLLEWRGTFCLHAGAVAVHGGCIAFAATPRAGKSSLLASCVAAGWPLVSDDILPIALEGDAFVAIPGYPGLKLWPDTVSRFVGDPAVFARIAPWIDKRRVAVGSGWGSFCATPLPLQAIYILYRDASDYVQFERILRRDAAMALIAHSFVDVARDRPMRLRQFEWCAGLARRIPVYACHIPHDLARLEAVPALIRQHQAQPAALAVSGIGPD